jgi:hypothetical protein
MQMLMLLASSFALDDFTLAVSAAPPAVSDRAAVWVLEKTGYRKAREGTNGYACLVSRGDHPLDLVPICHDANGVETLLPVTLRIGELRAAGKTEAEVKADIAEGWRTGRYRAPKPGGISYMLSTEGYTWNAARQRKDRIPPHVMVYAPYLRNTDLGIDPARVREIQQAGLPFVREEGTPHAFIIQLTPHWKPAVSQGGSGHH